MSAPPLVLITRPEEQGRSFAKQVSAIGATPLLDPLLEIVPLETDWETREPLDGLVLTSVHALQTRLPSGWQERPVFAIGATTGQKARSCGARTVYTAAGDFSNLTKRIEKILPPSSRLVYLRGEEVRHSLPENLPRYQIAEYVTYVAQEARSLSSETIAAIRGGYLHTLVVFSPRTAAILAALLVRQDLVRFLSAINLLSLSGAVLESLKDFSWKEARIAKTPDSKALLAELSGLL